MCLIWTSWFVLTKLLPLYFLLGYPQKSGLPTVRNSNSDWVRHTYTHTFQRGPKGLETGSGQIYPSPCQNYDLSTPGSVATDVSRQNAKETREKRGDNIYSSVSIVSFGEKSYMNTLLLIPLLAELRLFACSLAFHSKHIYSTPHRYMSGRHSCILCVQMLFPLFLIPSQKSWMGLQVCLQQC